MSAVFCEIIVIISVSYGSWLVLTMLGVSSVRCSVSKIVSAHVWVNSCLHPPLRTLPSMVYQAINTNCAKTRHFLNKRGLIFVHLICFAWFNIWWNRRCNCLCYCFIITCIVLCTVTTLFIFQPPILTYSVGRGKP